MLSLWSYAIGVQRLPCTVIETWTSNCALVPFFQPYVLGGVTRPPVQVTRRRQRGRSASAGVRPETRATSVLNVGSPQMKRAPSQLACTIISNRSAFLVRPLCPINAWASHIISVGVFVFHYDDISNLDNKLSTKTMMIATVIAMKTPSNPLTLEDVYSDLPGNDGQHWCFLSLAILRFVTLFDP